mmetsp:Transcript_20432/g.42726  ORF Transcript_20432/g.42726 Transcript_20432/m.42726 type:complete len:200 (-) Transcript_20432:421-1020(-)
MICQITRHDCLPICIRSIIHSIETTQHTLGTTLPFLHIRPVNTILHNPKRIHARGTPTHNIRLERIAHHNGSTSSIIIIIPQSRQCNIVHLSKRLPNPLHVIPRRLLRHIPHGMTVMRPHEPLVRIANRSGHRWQSRIRTLLIRIGNEHGHLAPRGDDHGLFHDLPIVHFIVVFGGDGRAVVDRECTAGYDQIGVFDGG